MKLIQFQCGREGTLFYYQSAGNASHIVGYCPACGSKRVKPTGREYPPVDETIDVKE